MYLLDRETSSYYKELTVNADGSYSFSVMKGAQTKTVAIDAASCGEYKVTCNGVKKVFTVKVK